MSWWNPYTDPARVLVSPLPPAACRERLRRRLAAWFAWIPSAQRPIKGRVTEAGFAVRRFEFGRHGFETEARGRFEAGSAGTRITIRFGLRRQDVIAFPVLILLFALMWAAARSERGGIPGAAGGGDAIPVWLPPAMVAGLFMLYAAHRWHLRGDGEFVVGLIRETLDASEARDQAPVE